MELTEGNLVRRMRLLAGYTQQQMADLMGFSSKSTISRIENDKIALTLRDAKRWAAETDNQDMLIAFIMGAQQVADVAMSVPGLVGFLSPLLSLIA